MSYFEFDDVKRFHQPYEDPLVRGPVWKPGYNNSVSRNFKKALEPAAAVALFYEPVKHFISGVQVLNGYYEWPKTRMETNIFFREVFRLPNFWSDMVKKMGFGFIHFGGDVGVKMASWKYVYGGTSSPVEFADYNAFKVLLCAQIAFIPTCWTAVPFEMASRAYYADKTWPVELRRGYTSPINALLRIPFEEGPSYLFKGGMTICGRDWLFYSFFCGVYTWLKNKMFFFWVYQDYPYNYCKFLLMIPSWTFAWGVAYPFQYAREMVDLWPKERGGHCTWNNSYNNCIRWMFENIDILYTNFFVNYWYYMVRKGFPIFGMMWMLDNRGYFTNTMDPHLNLETMFPVSMESV
jgi:hypothetical protein